MSFSVVLPTYWRKRCQACFSWQKDGTCKFGDACKYSQYVCMEGGGASVCGVVFGLCLCVHVGKGADLETVAFIAPICTHAD